MSEHFNKLRPAEAERLAILAEECGEVIQIVGKILRHGFESCHPDGVATNRQLLENELGDVSYAMSELMIRNDISGNAVNSRMFKKREKTKPFLHHQE